MKIFPLSGKNFGQLELGGISALSFVVLDILLAIALVLGALAVFEKLASIIRTLLLLPIFILLTLLILVKRKYARPVSNSEKPVHEWWLNMPMMAGGAFFIAGNLCDLLWSPGKGP